MTGTPKRPLRKFLILVLAGLAGSAGMLGNLWLEIVIMAGALHLIWEME